MRTFATLSPAPGQITQVGQSDGQTRLVEDGELPRPRPQHQRRLRR